MSVTTISPPTAGTAGTPSDLVGQYRETLKGLLEREKALAEQAAAGEDNQLRYKRSMLREMIRDTRAALRQLAPKRGKYHASRRSSLDGALTEARLSYLAWQRRESMEHTNREELEWMRAVIDDGTAVLTRRQRQVLGLRWRQGLRQRAIAGLLRVDDSTICRTLQRAEDKLRRYADARTLVARCTDSRGRLDVVRLTRETRVLTPRQREVLLLALAGLPPWAAAKKLGVHPSTASRTRIRAEWRLYRLVGVYRQGDRRAVDWDETCRAMAAEYGIGLGAVYKILGGLERGAEGPGLFQRQLLRRAEAGMSIKEIAAELELSERMVRDNIRTVRGGRMLTIIEIAARADGGHGLQSQSHRTANWMGDEWIAVPPELEQTVWDCRGYCTLQIEDGVLVGVTPGTPPEPPAPEPTDTDVLNVLLGVE